MLLLGVIRGTWKQGGGTLTTINLYNSNGDCGAVIKTIISGVVPPSVPFVAFANLLKSKHRG